MSKGSKANNSFFDNTRSVFVSGIHSSVTEEILWELFLQGGPLEHVKIPKDRETGKQRRFGFVVYQDKCSVQYACELFDSLKLFGRPISCKPQSTGSESPNASQSPNASHSQSFTRSFSDDDTPGRKRSEETDRPGKINFFGVDISPYGNSPELNGAGNRRATLNRSNTDFSPMDLRTRAMFNHSTVQRAGQAFHHGGPGPMRRPLGTYREGNRRLGQPY